jgi:hypothetical protein
MCMGLSEARFNDVDLPGQRWRQSERYVSTDATGKTGLEMNPTGARRHLAEGEFAH